MKKSLLCTFGVTGKGIWRDWKGLERESKVPMHNGEVAWVKFSWCVILMNTGHPESIDQSSTTSRTLFSLQQFFSFFIFCSLPISLYFASLACHLYAHAYRPWNGGHRRRYKNIRCEGILRGWTMSVTMLHINRIHGRGIMAGCEH